MNISVSENNRIKLERSHDNVVDVIEIQFNSRDELMMFVTELSAIITRSGYDCQYG